MGETSEKGIAVVTGASSGIGMVYADQLAKRGYDLVLIAQRGDKLDVESQHLREECGVTLKRLSRISRASGLSIASIAVLIAARPALPGFSADG